MGFKTITIKEEAYELIKAAKKEEESFTDFFTRKFEGDPEARLKKVMKYAGIWSGMSDKEYEEKLERMRKYREEFDRDAEERLKRMGIKE